MVGTLTWIVLFWTSLCWAAKPPTRPVIVIDPGHGGPDKGAAFQVRGKTVLEKEVTLALSQKIAKDLENENYNIVLTRTTDIDVSKPDRTAMANRLKAKLFISLHINTSAAQILDAGRVEGIETYILNHSTPASSKRLADLENAVLKDSVAEKPQNEVGLIIKDLILDSNRDESRKLACLVQDALVDATSPVLLKTKRNRGVKEGLFYILLGADMPSILLEAGFLGHPSDQYWLLHPEGQAKWVRAFRKALDAYFKPSNTTETRRLLARCKVH